MTWTLHTGNTLEIMPTLPERSVHCVVTSPPYWGLRDYGDPGQSWPAVRYQQLPGMPEIEIPEQVAALGLEPDPYAYVGHLVAIFREVRRLMRDDGTLWLNIGDSYSATGKSGGGAQGKRWENAGADHVGPRGGKWSPPPPELKPKDLIGIPWLLAFALRSDGWYLRSEIIWAKPNPMPESVRDRPTKGHEQVFLFSKSPRYWYDVDEVREDHSTPYEQRATKHGGNAMRGQVAFGPSGAMDPSNVERWHHPAGRNARSVWNIAAQPYVGAHFATMPPAMAERCIKAGCPADGVVYDPFTGSGTTGEQALLLGRRFEGTELSEQYSVLARERLLSAAERAGVVDSDMAATSNRPVQIGLFTNER